MNYIVIEMQTANGTTAVLSTVKATLNEALNHYYTILAAAAISSVPMHSASLLNERGQLVKYECFDHTPEPAEE